MATGKGSAKSVSKLKSICSECDEEYTGTSCPDCGNTAGNQKLASDGLRQQDHRRDRVFGSIDDLEGYSRTPDDIFLMDVQNAKLANGEYIENLRQAQVMKSQLKRIEVEEQLLKRQSSLDRLKGGVVDTYPPEHQSPEAQQISQMPLFGSQSPQAQFMSQLMRMNGENRAEFISQLSDADPQALSTLSGMFVQPMQNSGGYPGSMGGMYPPPWMTQQQPQKDSTESAVSMMKEMFGLMQAMQPKPDTSSADLVRDLKDELKSLHNRIDSVSENRSHGDAGMKPILEYINKLEQKIDASQYRPNFKEQAIELKDTIKALESIGLVNNAPSDATFDDKIRMKQIEHQIEMENRKLTLESDQAELSRSNQNTKEQLVKQLFSRSLIPRKQEPVDVPVQTAPYQPPVLTHHTKMISRPKNIVQEFESDSGLVCEVKNSNKYDSED